MQLVPKIKTVAKGNTPRYGGPEQLGEVPGWNALPAVRSGATLFLTNDNAAAFGNPTIHSVPSTLDLTQSPLAKLL